jgi:hypothetical protein
VYSACTAFYTNNLISCTGNTEIILGVGGVSTNLSFSANTFYGDGSNLTGISTQDTFVTGGTYSAGTAIFRNNTGGTFSVSGFSTGANFTGGTVSGATRFTNGLTANTISATTYLGISTQDTFVTGGTYSAGIAIFRNNTGGTFNVSGFYTGDSNNITCVTLSGCSVIQGINSELSGLTSDINALSATTEQIQDNYVPYTGATKDVDLGNNLINANKGFSGVWDNGYLYLGTEYDLNTKKLDFNSGIGSYSYENQQSYLSINADGGLSLGNVSDSNNNSLNITPNDIQLYVDLFGEYNSINIGVDGIVSNKKIVTDQGFEGNYISASTYNGYIPLSTEAKRSSGVTISFTTDTVYGTLTSPETSSAITANVTGALLGVTNILIHSGSTTPTFGSQYKKLSGSGNYSAGTINYIFCTYIAPTEIIYSINQR